MARLAQEESPLTSIHPLFSSSILAPSLCKTRSTKDQGRKTRTHQPHIRSSYSTFPTLNITMPSPGMMQYPSSARAPTGLNRERRFQGEVIIPWDRQRDQGRAWYEPTRGFRFQSANPQQT